MATNVVMPQMGESIAEGTIVRWIKKVGDKVDRDEPLFEISTDKVDAEIPSPAAGVLTEIKVKEGETVPVNSVVAVIGGAAAKPERPRRPDAAPAAMPARAGRRPESRTAAADSAAGGRQRDGRGGAPRDAPDGRSKDDCRRQKSSPLVRRIAQRAQRRHPADPGHRASAAA